MKLIENQQFKYLLAGFPILAFIYALISYSVNIPWLDDFEVGPVALYRWLQEVEFQKKMAIIWAPNNEHRVVTLKLLVLFNYYVLGQLNFKWMILQSHLYLIPLFIVIWKTLPKSNRVLFFLPVPYLFLNFQYYLSTYWMISSVQHNLVIGFGALAMYCLSKNSTRRFWLALGCTLMACLSNSDGLFFIPIGALVLLLQQRLRGLLIWLMLLSSAIVLFFWKYPSMNYHESGINYFYQHPLESLNGFFVFMGGGFDFWYREQTSFRLIETAFVGILLVFILLISLIRLIKGLGFSQFVQRFKDKSSTQPNVLFVLSMLLFCLMNAGAISILRSSWGEFVYLIGNYKIYPTLALVFVYLLVLLTWKPSSMLVGLISIFSIIFWGFSIANSLEDVRQRKILLQKERVLFRKGEVGLGFTAQQQKDFGIDKIMRFFESKGIYSEE
jgi:hypothetical protein